MRVTDFVQRRYACERGRKLDRAGVIRALRLAFAALVLLCALAAPVPASAAQPKVDPVAAGQTEPGLSHETAGPVEEEHAGRGIVDTLARVFNFAILVGTLVYLLKAPIRTYLADRSAQIRADLVSAAEMKEAAAAQIAEIDRRMKSLPAEIEALRAQGTEEIAAEQERIRTAAVVERDRLLEQARREIDLRVKIAERDLVAHAADLAVGVASERIRKTITDDDQKRLVERYVQQLRG